MRSAAAKALCEACDRIASGMAKKAEDGDVRSARFLCDLADEDQEISVAQEKQQAKRSLATEWANEPEWTPELWEQTAETFGPQT